MFKKNPAAFTLESASKVISSLALNLLQTGQKYPLEADGDSCCHLLGALCHVGSPLLPAWQSHTNLAQTIIATASAGDESVSWKSGFLSQSHHCCNPTLSDPPQPGLS